MGGQQSEPDDNQPQTASDPPPSTVVGIGASAGGLTALTELFAHVPSDAGVVWVVVVHLSPEHESRLADLLQPHVSLPVHQVAETVQMEADSVYVIPPNANLNAIDTHLRLSPLDEPPGKRATIDHFFRTLSASHRDHAVGVVLTGTGSDGALGLRDIAGRGGLAIVQDPAEAEHDGMPRSALATGLADLVLPLAEIPAAVARYARTQPRIVVPDDDGDVEEPERRLLQDLFIHLRNREGRDFSRYRRSTIMRRITRRMQLQHVEELEQYLELLRRDGEEAHALADDLLITVTRFFRDEEVFQVLEEDVVPRLFDGKDGGDTIRIWSAGCATGEEPYSLAMLLKEEASKRDAPPHIQIFASDLHKRSLQKGREGYYSGDIEADVSPERLQRFFQKEDGGYRIRGELREMVVFSPHDLLVDPPFSRLDLISCRNVLIYLQSHVQREVLDLFHYALNPDGFLVLGTSERAGDELFRVEADGQGVYRRRNVPPPQPRVPVFPVTGRRTKDPASPARSDAEPASYGGLHERMVERYAPPSLLLNPENRVVHVSEHAGRFLAYSGGEPSTSVMKVVRPELRTELQTALHEARESRDPVRTRPVELELDGKPRRVALDVRPAPSQEEAGFLLVLFDERPTRGRAEGSGGAAASGAEADPEADEADGRLREELNLARERLLVVTRRYEAKRGEMEAANQALQSTNEELRSTMEELETSKEELQSMNEELQTLNQENRHKVEELAQLSSDLQNLLTSTDIATLFLDRDLRIVRFTPSAEELFNVRESDMGRPISVFRHRLGYDQLAEDAGRVLERLAPVEREVQDEDDKWYISRILPYRTIDNRIDGVVLTFVDITHLKQVERELQDAKTYAESIVESLHESLLVLNSDLHVKSANPAFYERFDVRPGETEGRLIYNLGNGQWDIPELRTLLEDVLPENHTFEGFEVQHQFEGIGERTMLIDARRLDHVQLILLGIRDITDRRKNEEDLRSAKAEAEYASRVKSEFLSTMSHELRTPLTAILGMADLMESEVSGPVNETQKKYLERLKKSAWHLVGMIDEILGFSRTEAGKERIRLEDADLAEVTRDVAQLLETTAAESERELVVKGADEPIPAHTDPGRLTQILTNLVGNALKYTESGPIVVELEDGGPWAEIHVRDQGPGMAPDLLDRIFEPFVQGDSSTTRTYGGTGLGLTIAHRLTRLLGGDLTVQSTVGEGSTFTVRLPLAGPGETSPQP